MFLVASMVSPSPHPPARDVYFGAIEDAHPRSRARDVLGLYLREAGGHPPLRASEEGQLARTLRHSRAEVHSSSKGRGKRSLAAKHAAGVPARASDCAEWLNRRMKYHGRSGTVIGVGPTNTSLRRRLAASGAGWRGS